MKPNERIPRDNLYMAVAILFSLRATCGRLRVGAVLVNDNRVVSCGYNGTANGESHCDSNCDITKPCQRKVVHAEANVISNCAKNGIPTNGCTLYCTHSPCINCALLIVQAGITRVVYKDMFRDSTGLDHLVTHGVTVSRVDQDVVCG